VADPRSLIQPDFSWFRRFRLAIACYGGAFSAFSRVPQAGFR